MDWLLTTLSVSHVRVISHRVDRRYIRSLFRGYLFTNLQRGLYRVVNLNWVFLRNTLLLFVVILWGDHLANAIVVDHYTQTSKIARINIRL